MIANFRQFLRNAFGIYPGESKSTFRFIRLAIIWAYSSSIVEILSIGLFLEKLGADKLPLIYSITAISMIAISSLYIYFLKFCTPYQIITKVMLIGIFFYATAAIVIASNPPIFFFYILQIFTFCFVAALIACFWTFLDSYHDLQDAKRIYGIYNASYFAGCVLAGTTVTILVDLVGPSFLFMTTVFLLIVAIIFAKNIKTKTPVIEDDGSETLLSGGKKKFLSLIKIFTTSPFAITLVAMSVIIQILKNCTEFTYMETFQKIFAPHLNPLQSSNAITEFLGKLKAWIAGANIIVGMIFYRRLIKRINLGNTLLLPPIYFIMVYFEWLTYDSLFVAILAVIAIEGILYTIEDNNFNLLVTAAPSKLRSSLRIINDLFFEPTGMLISSLFLLTLNSHEKWFGLTLSFSFLVISIIVRYFYPKAVFLNLQQNDILFEKKLSQWFVKLSKKEQKELKQDIIDAFENNNEEDNLLACETLLAFNDIGNVNKLISYLNKFSAESKLKALELLEKSSVANNSKIIEMIASWTETQDENIVKHAHFYLAKMGFLHPEKVMPDLDSEDLFARAAAIITLKKSLADSSIVNAALNKTIAAKETELLLKFDDEEEICMGLNILSEDKGPAVIEAILKFLSHGSLTVKRMAAKALAKAATKSDSRHAFKIIEELQECSDTDFRLYCLQALGNIADSSTVKEILLVSSVFRPNEKRMAENIIISMGLKTVPILLSLIKDESLHERCRILAGKILGKLSLAQLKANLKDVLTLEIQRAHFYYYYGHTIQKKYPGLDLSLLKNALLSANQSVVDLIVHLLGAACPVEDCDLIVSTLRSKNEKAHAHAIETLEKNCDDKIFSKVLPLIEDTPKEVKLDYYTKIENSQLTLEELLNRLEASKSLLDKIIAAHLKAKLHMPYWKQSLREQIKNCDESFHHFAYELLES